MNQIEQKVVLNNDGYNQQIQESVQQLDNFNKANGITGEKLKTVKRQMREASGEAFNLAQQYSLLSEEVKNSQFGRQLQADMQAAIQKAGELKDLMGDVNREIGNIASDTRTWDTAKEGMDVLANSVSLAASAYGAFAGDSQTALRMMNLAQAATTALSAAQAIQNAVQKESNIMQTIASIKNWARTKSIAASTTATLTETAVTKASTVADKIDNAETVKTIALKGSEKVATIASTTAKVAETTATKGATIAQSVFNAVANANPYVLLATAIVTVCGALWAFASATEESAYQEKKAQEAAQKHEDELMLVSEYYDKTGKSLEGLEKIQERQPDLWAKLRTEAELYKKSLASAKEANDRIGASTGDLVSKFMTLQKQWSMLKTEAEKKKWIDDNQTAFNQLGLSVNNLNDAYNVLVKNAPKVIEALRSIAEARAYEEMYQEAIKKREREWNRRTKSRATGDYYNKYNESTEQIGIDETYAIRHNSEWKNAGIGLSDVEFSRACGQITSYYKLNQSGIDKINKYRNKLALESNHRQKKYYDDEVDYYAQSYERAQGAAMRAQQTLAESGTNIDANGAINGTTGGGKNGTTGGGKNGGNTTTTETPLEAYNKELVAIQNKYGAYLSNAALTEEEILEIKRSQTEDEINAITKYIDNLSKSGAEADDVRKELARLQPIINNLKNRLKRLKVIEMDNKIVKEANEDYAESIDKLNRDRKNGWITETEYNNQYLKAVEQLTNKLRTVTDINDELIDIINTKQKEISNIDFAKKWDEADIAVEGLIDDFQRIMNGQALGNNYYNEKRKVGASVENAVNEYETMYSNSASWKMAQTNDDKLDWIKDNQVASISLGVNKDDVNLIANIGDAANMSQAEIAALNGAIDRLNKKLGISFNSDDNALAYIRQNFGAIKELGADGKDLGNISKIRDVASATEEQIESLNNVVELLNNTLSSKWEFDWAGDFLALLRDNQALLEGTVTDVRNVSDAIQYAKNIITKRELASHSNFTGLVENDQENYEQFIKLNVDYSVIDDLQTKLNDYLDEINVTLNTEIDVDNLDEIENELSALNIDPIKKGTALGYVNALKTELAKGKFEFNPDTFTNFVKQLEENNINLKSELDVSNIDEIKNELQSGEIKVDENTLNALIEILDNINQAVNNDVAKVSSAMAKLQNDIAPRVTGIGGVENYRVNATPSNKVEKAANTFKTGYGKTSNWQNEDKVSAMQDQLSELIKRYQDAEAKLTQIVETNDKMGLQIDTRDLESQMLDLENRIKDIHDNIQESLNFRIRMEGVNDMLNGMSSLSNLGNSIATLGDTFDSIEESADGASEVFQKFGAIISVVQGIIEGVNTVMTIFNFLQDLFTAKTIASGVATENAGAMESVKAGEDIAAIPSTVALTAANKALEVSYLDLAAASIFAAHASIPFAGVGIATGFVSEMIGTMGAIKAATYAMGAFANGGIVSDGAYYGDSTLIRANKGEMLLNQHEQRNLFNLLDGTLSNPFSAGEVEFKISGDNLYGSLKNHKKIKSKTGHNISL